MRAIVINRNGNAGIITYKEVKNSVPAGAEFFIRVKATALNPTEHAISQISLPFPLRWQAPDIIRVVGKNFISLKIGGKPLPAFGWQAPIPDI